MPPQTPKPEVLSVRRLDSLDIERVRLWRNSEHVRNQMASQEVISESDQLKWFTAIARTKDEYFIYSHFQDDVGLLSIKPGTQDKSFEPGIYCGELKFLNHEVNFYASLWLYDYAFSHCQMEVAVARVLSTNVPALRLNKFLGFVENSEQTENFLTLILRKENYLTRREKLERFVPKWAQTVALHHPLTG